MKRYILLIIFSFSVLLGFSQKTQRQQMRDAEKIAVNWLNKLNNKQYVDCWDMFSETAQKLTNYKEWHAYFSTELMPELGDFISRKYYLAEMEKEIEGLPKGIYVTVRYQSQYTNTNTVEEILLLSQNEIGAWKILSYLAEYELKNGSGDVPKSRLK